MTVPNDVLTIWLPVAAAVLLGLFGLLRGVGRELVVAAAITLGALIVQQWAEIWGIGINELLSGASPGWSQFVIGLLVILGVTLFVGYMLGGRLAERPTSATARLMGGVLGAMNGAALAGWVLRSAYVGLDGMQPGSPLYQGAVPQGFMIWAGWFPVVLALLGTLYALLSPLRRARAAVERPSSSSDWTPKPASIPAASAQTETTSPVRSGSATVALPVLEAPTSLPASGSSDDVALWDRPRAALPDKGVTQPVSSQSTASAMLNASQEASWLGGQEPKLSDPVAPGTNATTALPLTESASDVTQPAGEVGKLCANCGTAMLPGATFCINCGTRSG